MVFYFILMKNGNTKSKIENIFGLLDSFACEVNALHACIKNGCGLVDISQSGVHQIS